MKVSVKVTENLRKTVASFSDEKDATINADDVNRKLGVSSWDCERWNVINMYICTYLYIYMSVYIYIYAHMYIYI